MLVKLDKIHLNPHNSNVMSASARAKLKRNLKRTGLCPPLIVRAVPDDHGGETDHYELIDGEQRHTVLAELGRTEAECVVWEISEAEALTALATLNSLRGTDDLHKRALLLERAPGVRRAPNQAPLAEAPAPRASAQESAVDVLIGGLSAAISGSEPARLGEVLVRLVGCDHADIAVPTVQLRAIRRPGGSPAVWA